VPAKPASESKLVTSSSGQPAAAGGGATKPHDDTFVIGNDDVLAINVWKEPDISRSIPVRSDGKISLPLAGEIQAAGRTPLKLERDIASKLQSYISEPEVTVMVQQINSEKFNILGQVTRPGSYPLTNSATVLDAIALAGGFRDFAKQKSIYILRQGPVGGQSRISFNYKDVIKGRNPEQNVKLEPRDTIVVP
jgi:polysaccharide export outer membrane protein